MPVLHTGVTKGVAPTGATLFFQDPDTTHCMDRRFRPG